MFSSKRKNKSASRQSRQATRLWQAAAGLTLALVPAAALADTYPVTTLADSGPGSLRQAILDANSHPGPDVVSFDPSLSGTVTLTNGELDITDSVDIQGPGSGVLTVSGNSVSRVLAISGPVGSNTVNLTGLTITGGLAQYNGGSASDSQGGGISNAGTLALMDCIVSNNQISSNYNNNFGGPYILPDSQGGGIYNTGELTVTNSDITSNYVYGNNGYNGNYGGGYNGNNQGGGIYNAGTLTVINSAVSQNQVVANYFWGGGGYGANQGGGIYNTGTVTVTNATVSDNGASSGGGIFSSGSLTMTASAVNRNSLGYGFMMFGGDGAAIDSEYGNLSLTNCTLSGNNNYFGNILNVLLNTGLAASLTNCTITGNTGNAAVAVNNSSNAAFTVESSLIAGNSNYSGPDVMAYGSTLFASGGSNLIGYADPSVGFVDGTNHDQVGTSASPIDPKVAALPAYGAPDQTVGLQSGSPAIDADYNGSVAADQRGVVRPQGARSDIGAFEYDGPITADDNYTASVSAPLTVTAPGVLGNDSDTYGDPLTASLVNAPAHGTLLLNPDGSFVYTPAAGYVGPDLFTYQAQDGHALTALANVAITVQDTAAPHTGLSVAGPQGQNGWYTGDVAVTLNATDDSGGPTTTYYTTDGSDPTTSSLVFTNAIPLSGDGLHSVKFFSVDGYGNAEAIQSETIKIDRTMPSLTFGAPSPAANSNGWYNAAVSIPYTDTDATSGVNDSGTGTVQIDAEGGSVTQTVALTDIAGNSKNFTTDPVKIDKTAPVTTASTLSTATGQQVTLSATDALSGVAATVYSVDGGAAQPYTAPFTVSGNGAHVVTFHSADKADNTEADQTVNFTTDVDAPHTGFSVAGPQGQNDWYTGDVTVTLNAQPGALAVQSTVYSLDGGAPQPYTAPFTVSGDAVHALTFHSVDAAGNAEAEGQQTVKIDGTLPSLTFGAPSPAANGNGWHNAPVTIPYTDTDATSGVDDNGTGTVQIDAEGKDQAQTVTITDIAGNSKDFTAPAVSVDLTPPTTTATPSGSQDNNGAYTVPVTVTLSATDALSGVDTTVYSVDGGTAQPYTAPFTVSGNGAHVVTFHSTDKADNTEADQTVNFTTDVDAPHTGFSVAGPQGQNDWYTGDVTVTLNAQPGALAVQSTVYSLDGGAPQPYTVPFTVSGDAVHALTFHSVDAAGNVEAESQQTIKIDGTPPTTTATPSGFQDNNGAYTVPVTVTLSAMDALSGVDATVYSVDSGTAQPYTAPFTVSGNGAHVVTFHSADKAGNTEADQTVNFTVAVPAPVPAPVVLHTFSTGLQMIGVTESYGSAGQAFSLSPSKLAVWNPALVQYTLQGPGDSLRPGQGYWVRLAQNTDLYDAGTPADTSKPFAIALTKGWNMVADPFPTAVDAGRVSVLDANGQSYSLNAAASAGLLYTTLFSYPAGATRYQSQDVASAGLSPYTGCWLYAFRDCTLQVAP